MPDAYRKSYPQKGEIIGQKLPENQEAERAVLGACLAFPQTALPVALEKIVAEDFYRPRHQTIFIHLGRLFIEGVGIDLTILCESLQKAGKLDECGGRLYLVSLKEAVATGKNCAYHCAIVKEKAVLRRLIDVGLELQSQGYADNGTKPSAIINQAGEQLFALLRGDAETGHRRAGRLDFDGYLANQSGLPGLSYGISDLDLLTGGMYSSNLIILAGMQSEGKTAFALHIARQLARQEKKVLFLSLEMSVLELTHRIICGEARINGLQLRTGRLTAENGMALNAFIAGENKKKIWEHLSVDEKIYDLKSLRAAIRLHRQQADFSLIILDYLTLLTGLETKDIVAGAQLCKQIAKEFEVPFLVLSQRHRPERGRETERPQPNSLLGAGIERDADVLLFVWNPAHHLRGLPNLGPKEFTLKQDYEKEIYLLLQKQRNGPTGECRVYFDRENGFFAPLEKPKGRRVD